MEVLTAAAPAGLVPFPSTRKPIISQPRSKLFFPNPHYQSHKSSPPSPNPNPPSKFGFSSGAAAASLVLSTFGFGFGSSSNALTYEEALEQSPFGGNDSIDFGGFVDDLVRFGNENPNLVLGGGVVVALALPLVLLSLVLGKDKANYGVVSAKNAYVKLGDDKESSGAVELLDIRKLKDVRGIGSPDLKGLKKKVVYVGYDGDDDEAAFLKKVCGKFKDPTNTTLFILDKSGVDSVKVAELVAANGFKSAFAIKDGAEGTAGWTNSGLPWIQPKRALNIDFTDLKEAIDSALGETSALPTTLGLAVATGLGALAFTEIETVLQLVGSAAVAQLFLNKLLFAEDRKKTLQQIGDFLNTKVAPKDLVDEIAMIGKAVLPAGGVHQSTIPIILEPGPVIISNAQEQETKPETKAPTGSATEVNSASQPDEKAASTPTKPRTLSPYPYYPDFKPPTSPSPSRP